MNLEKSEEHVIRLGSAPRMGPTESSSEIRCRSRRVCDITLYIENVAAKALSVLILFCP